MEIKKICRFLIFIFFVLAILFYSLYTAELKEKSVVSDELISGAVENLNLRDISVNEDVIYKNTPECDIYYFEIGEDKKHFEKICTSICKNLFGSEIVTTEFDTPEGFSVGIFDKSSYEKEIGRIILSESDLSFVYTKNGISMVNGDKPIENMQTDGITDDTAAIIDKVVSDINSGSKLGYNITGSSSSDDFLIVTAMQTIDGNEISDVYMNFVFQENELVIISGNWITEQPKAKYHNTLLDGVNVLYKLDLDFVSSIESESVVYSLRKTSENKCYIIPCWKIGYLDKDGGYKVSYFDAL